MNEQKYLPASDQLGVLTSSILLAYALSRLIQTPDFNLAIQLQGFYLPLPLNMATAMSLLTAGLTATGMDWLLRGHPALNNRPTFQWWILPTLTTFVVGALLATLPDGRSWWIGFAVSGAFIFFVFLAEYIVVDADAPYYASAMAGLTAVSYTLFFILAVALRYSEVRLYILIPTIFLAAGLASLRIMHLRFSGRWEYAWSAGIAFVCIQIAAGLHYWPLSPIQFGLMLVGPLYGLTNLAANLGEDQPARRAALEPAVATALCWGAAILLS
ncbi:MAG TPA: hypothetical protein VJ785_05850 [Anaerolineales bacterium]|nr:hypothetical protein [Anaerolineales bacterium]